MFIVIIATLYFFNLYDYYLEVKDANKPNDKYGYLSCVVVAILRQGVNFMLPFIVYCMAKGHA